jgi:hypothetical protein
MQCCSDRESERRYQEGLRRTSYSLPPGLPSGDGVYAGALAYPPRDPSVVCYRDLDIHNSLGFDDGVVRIL